MLVLAAASASCVTAQSKDSPARVQIPALQGATFAGTPVNLPAALQGRIGILVIGFSRSSQESARAWGQRLDQRYPAGSSVVYYEMPVLAGVPALLRGWVSSRIRQSIAAPARDHFLPVLDHEAEWKQAAGSISIDNSSVLVVDAHGAIRWRCQGTPNDAAFAELEHQVALLQ